MPRKAREISDTGIYHVLLRGIDNRNIFKNDQDKQKFVDLMLKKRDTSHFNLYAYCVMDNHVHLAIRADQRTLSSCVKGISIGYVCYFNKNYGKAGHLFYDRYKSETIKEEKQLLALVRFIHNNPIKENKVNKAGEYEWSSYNLYISESEKAYGSEKFKKDINEILYKLSSDKKEAKDMFCEFTKIDAADIFCDYNVSDKNLEILRNKKIAKEIIAGAGIGSNAWESDREVLRVLILKLRNEHNISLRQIAEILKLHRGLVQRLSMP